MRQRRCALGDYTAGIPETAASAANRHAANRIEATNLARQRRLI